jgi:hypothetical protein
MDAGKATAYDKKFSTCQLRRRGQNSSIIRLNSRSDGTDELERLLGFVENAASASMQQIVSGVPGNVTGEQQEALLSPLHALMAVNPDFADSEIAATSLTAVQNAAFGQADRFVYGHFDEPTIARLKTMRMSTIPKDGAPLP